MRGHNPVKYRNCSNGVKTLATSPASRGAYTLAYTQHRQTASDDDDDKSDDDVGSNGQMRTVAFERENASAPFMTITMLFCSACVSVCVCYCSAVGLRSGMLTHTNWFVYFYCSIFCKKVMMHIFAKTPDITKALHINSYNFIVNNTSPRTYIYFVFTINYCIIISNILIAFHLKKWVYLDFYRYINYYLLYK